MKIKLPQVILFILEVYIWMIIFRLFFYWVIPYSPIADLWCVVTDPAIIFLEKYIPPMTLNGTNLYDLPVAITLINISLLKKIYFLLSGSAARAC